MLSGQGMDTMSLWFPFDLTNGLATLTCIKNSVFHPYLDNFLIVFFDDILVYSRNQYEHVENQATTLILLRA